MRFLILGCLFLLSGSLCDYSVSAEPEVVALWEGNVPGAAGSEQKDTASFNSLPREGKFVGNRSGDLPGWWIWRFGDGGTRGTRLQSGLIKTGFLLLFAIIATVVRDTVTPTL